MQALLSVYSTNIIWYLISGMDEKIFYLQIKRWKKKTRFLSILAPKEW